MKTPTPHAKVLSRARRGFAAAVATLVLLGWAAESPAQGTTWNRKVESIAVVPSAATLGAYEAHVVWSVGLDETTSVPLDLSTEVQILVNGTPASSSTYLVSVDPASGFCTDGGSCGGSCGSGYIDGVFNQLLCLPEGPGDCACRFPSITAPSGSPPPELQVEDEIMVLLMPAAGALPDPDPSDDVMIITFDGDPIYWNRQITSVDVTPTPVGTDLWDVRVDGAVQFKGLLPYADWNGEVHLGMNLDVLVNGTTVASAPLDFDPLPLASGVGCSCGQTCATGPLGEDLECFWDPVRAVCSCNWIWEQTFPGIALAPGDSLTIHAIPVPGALPELPGFEEDDEFDLACCPTGTGVEVTPKAGAGARLEQNRPNPFGSATTIAYATTAATPVTLEVFDVHGRRVRALLQGARHGEPGDWSVSWDARDAAGRRVPSGIYFYRLTANGTTETRKMTVLTK